MHIYISIYLYMFLNSMLNEKMLSPPPHFLSVFRIFSLLLPAHYWYFANIEPTCSKRYDDCNRKRGGKNPFSSFRKSVLQSIFHETTAMHRRRNMMKWPYDTMSLEDAEGFFLCCVVLIFRFFVLFSVRGIGINLPPNSSDIWNRRLSSLYSFWWWYMNSLGSKEILIWIRVPQKSRLRLSHLFPPVSLSFLVLPVPPRLPSLCLCLSLHDLIHRVRCVLSINWIRRKADVMHRDDQTIFFWNKKLFYMVEENQIFLTRKEADIK